MIRKSIINLWRESPELKLSGQEVETLRQQRTDRLIMLLKVGPIVALDPADFADFVVVLKVDHYRRHVGGCTFDFDEMPEVRAQVHHVIKSRYAITPESFLSGTIDDLAREIARRIEDVLDDQVWEAA